MLFYLRFPMLVVSRFHILVIIRCTLFQYYFLALVFLVFVLNCSLSIAACTVTTLML